MKIIQTTPAGFALREDDWSNPSERAAGIKLGLGGHAVPLKRKGYFATLERSDQIAKILLSA